MTLILSGTDSSVSAPAVQGGTAGTTTGVYYPASNQLALATNGTQAVLVDSSQNVGIGTASPSYKLEVSSASGSPTVARLSGGTTSTSDNTQLRFYGKGSATNLYAIGTDIADGGTGANFDFFDLVANTNRMRIDASGNVGIGGTPNAWAGKATQIGTYIGFGVDANGYGIMANNAWNYTASSYKYTVSGLAASLYSQNFGQHNWYSTSSGTAGNAIGFTQILSVDLNKSLALQGATSATGTGIAFPATQSASSDANTLDDYEEGTWSPSVGGNATYSNQIATYTKVGRLVTCNFDLSISTIGTGSTTSITNFPFTNATGPVSGAISYYVNLATAVNFISFYINTGSTNCNFVGNTASTTNVGLNGFAVFGSSTRVIGSVTYPTS